MLVWLSDSLSTKLYGTLKDTFHKRQLFQINLGFITGSTQTVTIGINFNDSTQTAKFDLVASGRVFTIQIQPQIGELVRGVSMPESLFDQEKLKLTGMNEVDDSFELPSALSDEAGIKKRIYEVANVVQVDQTPSF